MPTRGPARWVIAIPMALLAVATLYPLLFTLNVSQKTRREYVLDRFGLADGLHLDNVVDAWQTSDLGTYTLNSTS